MEKRYTVKQAAEILARTENAARCLVKRGKIRSSITADGRRLIPESALQEFLNG